MPQKLDDPPHSTSKQPAIGTNEKEDEDERRRPPNVKLSPEPNSPSYRYNFQSDLLQRRVIDLTPLSSPHAHPFCPQFNSSPLPLRPFRRRATRS